MESGQLKSLPLFEGLSDDDADKVASMFQETELLNGTGLTREGEFAYKFFVVLEGEVEVQRHFKHVATLGPGDFFGEMGILTNQRRNARILAKSRCRLAWIMGWDFEAMTEEFPVIAERIQAVVDERMATVPDDD